VLAMRKKWRKSLLTLLVAILVILLFIFVELQRVRVESQYHQKYGIPEEITKMKD
jgi:cytochrome c-type biogenesis protein CcmH/NrfG